MPMHLSTCPALQSLPCTCGADSKRSEREARENLAGFHELQAIWCEEMADEPNRDLSSQQYYRDEATSHRARAMALRGK